MRDSPSQIFDLQLQSDDVAPDGDFDQSPAGTGQRLRRWESVRRQGVNGREASGEGVETGGLQSQDK